METKIKNLLARLAFFAEDGMAEPGIVAMGKDAEALLKEMCRAQPEPAQQAEPVAWQYRARLANGSVYGDWHGCSKQVHDRYKTGEFNGDLMFETRELYAKQQAEPVALTNEQIEELWWGELDNRSLGCIRNIIAAAQQQAEPVARDAMALANEVRDAVIAEITKDNIISITGAVIKRAKRIDLSAIVDRYASQLQPEHVPLTAAGSEDQAVYASIASNYHQPPAVAVPQEAADSIRSPFNACCNKEHCRAMLAAAPQAATEGCGACGDGCQGQGCRLERESPPTCQTCNGQGMIGGLLPDGGGYDGEPCPDCSAPQASVAMPEPHPYAGKRKGHPDGDFSYRCGSDYCRCAQ